MTRGGAIALGVVSVLGTIGAIAAAASSSSAALPSSPTPNPTPTPTPGTSSALDCGSLPPLAAGWTWQPATSVAPGDRVRISVPPDVFDTVASSITNLGTGIAGWTALLAMPQVQGVLGTLEICAWAPGDALPQDWPTGDTNEATEYHADFTYQGTVNLPTAQMPIPSTVWVAKGPTTKVGSTTVPSGALSSQTGGVTPTSPAPAPAASTAQQTATLTSGGGDVYVTGTLPGTPIVVVLSGGGTFTGIDAQEYGPNATEVETAGYPLQTLPPLPWWTFTTPAASGVLLIDWTDASGNPQTTSLTYS